jgi:hypothetical protein
MKHGQAWGPAIERAARVLLQALFYLPLMLLIGYFSRSPAFVHLPADQAILRMSIARAAERLHPCRERSAEELAKLAPNMRAAQDCPRERAPLALELEVDGERLLQAVVQPSGVQKDGVANFYRRVALPAGPHRIVVRMRDRPQGGDNPGYNHVLEQSLTLAGGDSLLIDFNPARGGLEIRR